MIADPPDGWRAAGFEPDGHALQVGSVRLRLEATRGGRGIVGWSLRGLEITELDGLPTTIAAGEPAVAARQPNGVTAVDHVVAFTPDLDRTVDALRALADDGHAVLLITHDIAAAERAATDVAVMYASRIVEQGPAAEVFTDPWHPYTRGLLAATPSRGLRPLPGHPPNLSALPSGCAFRPRCPSRDTCADDPALVPLPGGRFLACAHHGDR